MPEIKHNFTGGKMNKDLDERLVPDGEYRDAMNIQVSTSEGSDVGAVQNILGNTLGCGYSSGYPNPIPPNATTIGSVSDEKNDSLYWLVSGLSTTSSGGLSSSVVAAINALPGNLTQLTYPIALKDMIMRRGENGCEPVFVDAWGYLQNDFFEAFLDSYSGTLSEITSTAGMYIPDEVTGVIGVGWQATTLMSDASILNTQTVTSTQYGSSIVPYEFTYIPGDNTTVGYWWNAMLALPNDLWCPVFDSGAIEIWIKYPEQDFNHSFQSFDPSTVLGLDLMATPVDITVSLFSNTAAEYNITQPGTTIASIELVIRTVGNLATGLFQDIPYYKITLSQPTYNFTVPPSPPLASFWDPNQDEVYCATAHFAASDEFTDDHFQVEISWTEPTLNGPTQPQIIIDDIWSPILDQVSVGDEIISYEFATFGNNACVNTIDQPVVPGDWQLTVDDCAGNILVPNDGYAGQAPYGPGSGFINFDAESTNVFDFDAPLQVADSDGVAAEYLLWTNPNGRVLNFNIDKPITGINIVDDMLFWTDNNTEPKKINIPRSIEGTDPQGNQHTRLINPIVGSPPIENYLVEEKHITVIKKPPNRAPIVSAVIEYLSGTRYLLINNTNNTSLPDNTFQGPSGVGAVMGDSVWVLLSNTTQVGLYEVGDVLRFLDEGSPLTLPEDYQIRASITRIEKGPYTSQDNYGIEVAEGETALLMEILSMSEDAPISSDVTGINWNSAMEQVGKVLFERKFPRFACRYKYLDNEYSTIGPFTDVVFIPGGFSYEPTRAYNTGMVNNLKSLVLQDFIPTDIPEDVIQVDILYKNETNPNVYIIDSITKKDSIPTQSIKNPWNADGSVSAMTQTIALNKFPTTGSYKISTENIYAALSNDQILRVWDNVPRKALAQEITGNRIVYGNYLQNYSLKNYNNGIPYGNPITPDITVSLGLRTPATDIFGNLGKKSIKSLRDYEIGIVWGDKYGRETPVITPNSGSISVPKIRAQRDHFLSLALENSPSWADYYKFYIKETSNEYYNLALGRSYDAEDGNIWLSFPSVDRNKVDEDTYLILKKAIDSEVLVVGDEPAFSSSEGVSSNPNARYKIVAIENEAPEYIKTTYTNLISTNTDDSRPSHSCNLFGGENSGVGSACSLPVGGKNAPTPGRKTFTLSAPLWSERTYSTLSPIGMALQGPDKIFEEVSANPGKDQLWIEFEKKESTGATFSSKYHVVGVELGNEDDFSESGFYIINLASPILEADGFITGDGALVLMNDNIHVHFYKKTIENKPEFDGRFFVKILNDKIAQKTLKRQSETVENFSTTAAVSVFEVKDGDFDAGFDNAGNLQYSFSGDNGRGGSGNQNGSSTTRTRSHWESLLRFGEGTTQSRWFIDRASFASRTMLGSNYMSPHTMHTFNNTATNPSQVVDSCDKTTDFTVNYKFNYNVPFFGWKTSSYDATESVGTGLSNGNVGMKGAFSNGTTHYFDLSYSRIGPRGDGTSNWGKTENFNVDWEVGVPGGNSFTDEEANVVSNLVQGTRFRFRGNPTVYKITSAPQIFNLFNYRGRIHHDSSSTHMYKEAYLSWNSGPEALLGTFTHWSDEHRSQTEDMTFPQNRRKTYRIQYEWDQSNYEVAPTDTTAGTLKDGVDGADKNLVDNTVFNSISNTSAQVLQFLQEYETDADNPIPSNPAIFETEPKEDVDLDLYYEASENFATLPISESNRDLYIPIGSTIVPEIYSSTFSSDVTCMGWVNNGSVKLSSDGNSFISQADFDTIENTFVKFVRPDGSFTMGKVGPANPVDYKLDIITNEYIYYALNIIPDNKVGLGWFNCWSFNNGVESNRVGDTYNKPYIINGAKVSTTLDKEYEEENRKYGLIYSGIYNSNSGINSLNQFISGQKITKDINPIYGSIQKLHSRSTADGDLITLCEDRVLKILANKDALFNADGDINLTATENVLGQAMPYAGEYGISKDPESFASEAYRAYFTDRVRGAVLRLSKDGLTPISDYGMKDWFKDNLRPSKKLIGSYDDKKDEYNITLTRNVSQVYFGDPSKTLTFREDVKGWVSFKSFIPENAISCANEYYTFQKGILWRHHSQKYISGQFPKEYNRNTFYNVHTPTSFEVVLNEAPGTVKTFKTINYEGSQSKIDQLISYDTFAPGSDLITSTLSDGEYYNLQPKTGWFVESIITNKEEGGINEFIEKEGKWFNYIKGKTGVQLASGTNPSSGNVNSFGAFDNGDNSFQGLGIVAATPVASSIFGCTNNDTITGDDGNSYPAVINYNDSANVDDGTCIPTVLGCMDSIAGGGFLASANMDTTPTSCIYFGCTDVSASNYDDSANSDDGSCIATVNGCTDGGTFTVDGSTYNIFFNYNPLATVDDGTCESTELGCTSDAAFNWNNTANTDDGSCCYNGGCTDATAFNYDATACADDGSCTSILLGCMNPTASNYAGPGNTNGISPAANTDDGSCTYIEGCTDDGSLYTDSLGNSVAPSNQTPNATVDDGSCIYVGCMDDTAENYESFYNQDSGNCTFVVDGCTDDGSDPNFPDRPSQHIGAACNYNSLANNNDGSCVYPTAANTDCNGVCEQGFIGVNGVCVAIVSGCTDDTADNYDPNANVDDGSCDYFSLTHVALSWALADTLASDITNPGNGISAADFTYQTFDADGGQDPKAWIAINKIDTLTYVNAMHPSTTASGPTNPVVQDNSPMGAQTGLVTAFNSYGEPWVTGIDNIGYFTALETITTQHGAAIRVADFRGLTNLKHINLYNNAIHTMFTDGCTNLETINLAVQLERLTNTQLAANTPRIFSLQTIRPWDNVQNGNDSEGISFAENSALTQINLDDNWNLENIDGLFGIQLNPCPNLTSVQASNCLALTSFNIDQLNGLVSLNLSGSAIVDMTFLPAVHTNLKNVNFEGCGSLATTNIGEIISLENLNLRGTSLATNTNPASNNLNLMGLVNLQELRIHGPNITNLVLNNLPNLHTLYAGCSPVDVFGNPSTNTTSLISCSPNNALVTNGLSLQGIPASQWQVLNLKGQNSLPNNGTNNPLVPDNPGNLVNINVDNSEINAYDTAFPNSINFPHQFV